MAGKYAGPFLGLLAGAWLDLPAGALAADDAEVSGFGVVVSANGDVLAPFHAIADCMGLSSPTLGRLRVLHADSRVDLAHLEAETYPTPSIAFGESATVKPGDTLTVLELAPGAPPGPGFVTHTVTVRALIGSMQTASFINLIDAARGQQGGALLLDGAGGLVGFVVRDLDTAMMAELDVRLWGRSPPDGALSRDAVGAVMLRHFLDHHHVAYAIAPSGAPESAQAAVDRARAASTSIECGR